MTITKVFPVLVLTTVLAACGGSASVPASSPAQTSSAKPAASASAPAKPAASGASTSTNPAASGAASPAASGKLATTYSEIYEGQIPVWVTQDAGFFKENGLDVEQTYVASSNVIAALISGQVVITQGGGSEALSAAAAGADLVVIGNIVPVYPYMLYVSANIKTTEDLKGKKLGVSNHGSASDIATRVALKKVGLDPEKDVSIITVGSSQNRTAALQSGAIQGGVDQPPPSYLLEKQGLHALFDMASLKAPTVNNGIIVKRSWLVANRSVAQKYVDSIVQGIARTKSDRQFAADTLAKYMKLDDKDAVRRSVDYADDNLFASAPIIKEEDFADAADILAENNARIKTFDVNKLIDNSLVQSAIDRGLDR